MSEESLLQSVRDASKLKNPATSVLSENAIVLLEEIDGLKVLVVATTQKADSCRALLASHTAEQTVFEGEQQTLIDALQSAITIATQKHEGNLALIYQHHVASGRLTTVGGAATEEFTVAKVHAGDYVQVQIEEVGETPVSIVCAKCLEGKISVTFSGDPADDHVINFFVGE